ncbi:hypothetical protein OH76DRAFT_857151 [Lentinus brumalis]|uniref:Secreted protein n=1 Tax=Lentinus brumalis TaxID=2498619 RepID=A0A371DR59_9APHY|nr:hypothetical protein OH76DRAFT_857151 [Polyporus brumalis]
MASTSGFCRLSSSLHLFSPSVALSTSRACSCARPRVRQCRAAYTARRTQTLSIRMRTLPLSCRGPQNCMQATPPVATRCA